MNAIFQDLMLLCIIWQGIDWLRQRRFVPVSYTHLLDLLTEEQCTLLEELC